MTSMIYVSDIDKWKRNFLRMTEGKTMPNQKGQYLVNSLQSGGSGGDPEPKIKVVTPVAQAVELAKSELAREDRETAPRIYKSVSVPRDYKRKKTKTSGERLKSLSVSRVHERKKTKTSGPRSKRVKTSIVW
jgi:hypothetical protein